MIREYAIIGLDLPIEQNLTSSTKQPSVSSITFQIY